MLRIIRQEGWFFAGFLILWCAIIAVAWAVVVFSVGKAHSAPKAKKPAKIEQSSECAPLPADAMERLKASGLEYEIVTDAIAVLKIVLVLKANTDKPFQMPTSLVIVFIGEEAKIGIISGDKICAVITGPADAVRAMLKRVHGQTVLEHGA